MPRIGRRTRNCLLAIALLLPTAAQAKTMHVEPGKTEAMPGGDERDIIDFYPFQSVERKRIDPNTFMTLTVTPQGDQPRAVILYNKKQVEIERQIMFGEPVRFHIKRSEAYAFIRVTAVGSRYDQVAGSAFTRSPVAPDRAVIALQPYNVHFSEAHLPDTPATTPPPVIQHAEATPPVANPVPAPSVPKPLPPTIAAPRLALLIGNAAYGAQFGSLANPVRDVTSVAAALRNAGFQVEIVSNVDQKAMKRAIIAFGQRLGQAGQSATGLFYYAGHGVQSRGTNYLVPIGAAIETEADVDIEAVAADTVLRQMEAAGVSTSIVILDACRNLPIQRSLRDGTRGLARMDAPNGSFVAYSTAPGAVAVDGTGSNSPFASALVAEMGKPGQPIEAIFRNVRRTVSQATAGKQTPWDSSSLMDSFVFTPDR